MKCSMTFSMRYQLNVREKLDKTHHSHQHITNTNYPKGHRDWTHYATDCTDSNLKPTNSIKILIKTFATRRLLVLHHYTTHQHYIDNPPLFSSDRDYPSRISSPPFWNFYSINYTLSFYVVQWKCTYKMYNHWLPLWSKWSFLDYLYHHCYTQSGQYVPATPICLNNAIVMLCRVLNRETRVKIGFSAARGLAGNFSKGPNKG